MTESMTPENISLQLERLTLFEARIEGCMRMVREGALRGDIMNSQFSGGGVRTAWDVHAPDLDDVLNQVRSVCAMVDVSDDIVYPEPPTDTDVPADKRDAFHEYARKATRIGTLIGAARVALQSLTV